jgi:hypothetical protein
MNRYDTEPTTADMAWARRVLAKSDAEQPCHRQLLRTAHALGVVEVALTSAAADSEVAARSIARARAVVAALDEGERS